MKHNVPYSVKFWSRVDKNGPIPKDNPTLGVCWVWTGAFYSNRYGSFWDGSKTTGAHRESYRIAYGEIPDGMFICHRCNNRACVNPDHLFLGDASTNNLDKTMKGRHHNTKKTHCIYGHELTPENLLPSNRNERICKLCVRRRTAEYNSSKKELHEVLQSFNQPK